MEKSITMSEKSYEEFLKCLTNLKDICNDIDVREGIIRQRTNDLISVFELDLKVLIEDSTFAISDLKTKLEILKTFSGQDEIVIDIVSEGNHINFSDQYSSVKFKLPTLDFLDNKFMTVEERDKIFVMEEEDLILECDLESIITDRIRIISAAFNTKAIQVSFDGEESSISAITQGKDQSAKFLSGITTNIILENSSSNITTVPFVIEHDSDIVFKMFKDPDKPISLNKFSTNIGDVDINVYTRASIVKEDDS